MSANTPFASAGTVGDRAFALDAATVLAVSVAIVVAAHQLLAMTIAVPLLLVMRHVLWARLPHDERGQGGAREALLVTVCTLLGAFNDWSSVVRHGIYDYGVPVYFPGFSTIPIWMLLFWGMILRFFYTLARWKRIRPPARANDELWLGRMRRAPMLRVVLLLAITFATRQAIYRWYLDPVLSWLPFAVALLVYVVSCRPRRYEWTLLGLALGIGPVVEVVYIQLGGLHRYHLGWMGGVPLWIALWWGLALLVWAELVLRANQALDARGVASVDRPSEGPSAQGPSTSTGANAGVVMSGSPPPFGPQQ